MPIVIDDKTFHSFKSAVNYYRKRYRVSQKEASAAVADIERKQNPRRPRRQKNG